MKLFFLFFVGLNCFAQSLPMEQATQVDGLLSQKAITVCEKLSQEAFNRFKSNPKRIKDFVDPDPKIMKITCGFAYKEDAQDCAKAFLKNMEKITAKTQDKIIEQGKPHQSEFESCLRKTEERIAKKMEKAATDQATADSLVELANKKINSRAQ